MITDAMRRYAAEIYRLQEDQEYVSISELSEHIYVSLQAISRMVGRLKKGGYIIHEPYRGVRLTHEGETIALPAIRRHRLIEVFLVRVMGFGWHEVHDVSDQFELGINNQLEQRIDEILGYPSRCPHGEPIPSPDGEMPAVQDASLVESKVGKTYRISRVRVHDPDKLLYLGNLGLYPGAEFSVLSFAPFSGPVHIQMDHKDIVLSYELAAALFVEM